MEYLTPLFIFAAGLGITFRITRIRMQGEPVPFYMRAAQLIVAAMAGVSLLIVLRQQGVF